MNMELIESHNYFWNFFYIKFIVTKYFKNLVLNNITVHIKNNNER